MQRCTKGVVPIQENTLVNRSSSKLIHEILQSMRAELDEHRSVINENTNESQTNFEFICSLDKRIDAIEDRLNELILFLKGTKKDPDYKVQPLSAREKELFIALLSLSESLPSVTYAQLSQQMGWSTSIVASYLSRMIDKGVPINRQMSGGVMQVSINENFRRAQIRQNVVGLEVPLTRWMG